ncbi:GNAT family N-acetyltransferase [Thiolinea disciformis]|uniref:GNAT family N-acetyltransferase n=1 Tax=Thiolinea disciformis TaxID=125614 RepID=UPI00036CB5A8|nr:GNAT family N-acetyltransferase [Thiolinea disciformis]
MLETKRLQILPPSLKLQPLILAAIVESQNDLKQFLAWVPSSLTVEASIKNTEQAIANFQDFDNELRFSLIAKASGQFVGAIGLIIRDKQIPFFEMGYWLRSSCVGFGYMSEAVVTLEDYAFNVLKAKRVEIKMAENNWKSRAVAERCGYVYEGTHKNDRMLPNGKISNTVVYAKTSL